MFPAIISRNYRRKHVELIEIIDNKIVIVASSWLFISIPGTSLTCVHEGLFVQDLRRCSSAEAVPFQRTHEMII